MHNTVTTFINHPEQNFLLNQVAAVRTAQSLYHTANTLKDAAQNEYTFFLFYKDIILTFILPICRNKTPDFLMPEDIFTWLGVIKDKKLQNT